MLEVVEQQRMSGWLSMFRESARGLTGEIVISGKSLSGFADYEKVIAELNDLSIGNRKVVKAAVPTIETFGLINIGGKHAIFNIFSALVEEGDDVIIPTPYWVSFADIARYVGMTQREYGGASDDLGISVVFRKRE